VQLCIILHRRVGRSPQRFRSDASRVRQADRTPTLCGPGLCLSDPACPPAEVFRVVVQGQRESVARVWVGREPLPPSSDALARGAPSRGCVAGRGLSLSCHSRQRATISHISCSCELTRVLAPAYALRSIASWRQPML
jgi:hypothetical protein